MGSLWSQQKGLEKPQKNSPYQGKHVKQKDQNVSKGVPCMSRDRDGENQGAPNISDHIPTKKKKGKK
jgi:hypothetical protein